MGWYEQRPAKFHGQERACILYGQMECSWYAWLVIVVIAMHGYPDILLPYFIISSTAIKLLLSCLYLFLFLSQVLKVKPWIGF
jgi:hypothetical protein